MIPALSENLVTKPYRIVVAIEKEPGDRGYLAYSSTLPGCFSNGRTVQEARRNMRAAMRLHIRALTARRRPIPRNDRLVHAEAMTFRMP